MSLLLGTIKQQDLWHILILLLPPTPSVPPNAQRQTRPLAFDLLSLLSTALRGPSVPALLHQEKRRRCPRCPSVQAHAWRPSISCLVCTYWRSPWDKHPSSLLWSPRPTPIPPSDQKTREDASVLPPAHTHSLASFEIVPWVQRAWGGVDLGTPLLLRFRSFRSTYLSLLDDHGLALLLSDVKAPGRSFDDAKLQYCLLRCITIRVACVNLLE
ncbi:hypothetical protein C8Q74DRAFT_1050748 [Fomes fomentarius]|nr:hypothetical protein C8Q74DRAFT_1050748 [Fomes fomentarius]